MDQMTFDRHFRRLLAWFNRKESGVSISGWYDRVRMIPDEAWSEVVDRICDTAGKMPTPQEVRNYYLDWLASRPEQKDQHRETWCPDCNGSGAIRVEITEDDGWIRDTLYRCQTCDNWKDRLGDWVPQRLRSVLEQTPGVVVKTKREREDGEGYVEVDERSLRHVLI
jgi:RecJ-like exonuclease